MEGVVMHGGSDLKVIWVIWEESKKGLQTSWRRSNKLLLLFACWCHIWHEIRWQKVNQSISPIWTNLSWHEKFIPDEHAESWGCGISAVALKALKLDLAYHWTAVLNHNFPTYFFLSGKNKHQRTLLGASPPTPSISFFNSRKYIVC